MKILEKLPKFTRVPKIVSSINPEEEEFCLMITNFPIKVRRAIKAIFEDGTPISVASKQHSVSKQLIRYYLNKMHIMQHNKPYRGKNG